MKHVGFITSSALPHLTESDSYTIEPLKKLGINVEPIIWTSPPSSYSQFDAIIMRSAWDYHTKPKEFTEYLLTLKQLSIPIYNPVDCMLWNMDKSYLLELASRDIKTIPTILAHTIDDILWTNINEWREIIIKPTIGASAHGIQKINTAHKDAVEDVIKKSLLSGPIIIQPFINKIREGEYSFIFFDKKYSHAVLKTPKKNDYRSQSDFGAKTTSVEPRKDLVNQASAMLEKIPYSLLYARIDAIEMKGVLYLMELELIEPHLFIENAPEAATTFADAIARSI